MPPKRKRANTATNELPMPAQPSSRDASDESTTDPILDEVAALKQKQDSAASASKKAPADKRSKASADGTNDASETQQKRRSSRHVAHSSQEQDEDPEPKHIEKAPLVSKNGKAEDVEMEQPQKAGRRDPIGGYKTNPPPEGRAVRVYADGVFDLFHLGHMRQLEQAKTAFPNTHLTVGVTGDAETHRRKGLTVLSAAQRAETVRHCRWVDEVVDDCPWVVSTEFLAEHKIDYVAHDDEPYGAAEGDDIYAPIKKQGKFLVTERTEGVSTTGIITTIVRDYEQYVGRQLKRGTSRQELNVSWLKKNELDLKRHVAELRDSLRTNWSTTSQELGRELKGFWDRSRPASPAPSLRKVPSSDQVSASGQKSPTGRVSAVAHLGHLDVPRSPTSPGEMGRERNSDFATGYTLGLAGGIRSWMTKNRRNVLTESQAASEGSEEDELSGDMEMDEAEGQRGRKKVNLDQNAST